jgi:ABC-2 type transport system permease protein
MISRTLKSFVKKELKQTLRDPRMRIVLFVAPMMQTIVFGFALSMEVRNIKLAISAAPDDVVARRVMERALTSEWFVSAKTTGSDPIQWIEAGQAEVVLVTPKGGLTHAEGRNEGDVQALIDATNILRAQSVEQYLNAILRELKGREPAIPRVALSVRLLFNPAQETSIFLIPGLVCLILCVVTILLTAMSLSREKEMGTFEMLISAPINTREIVFGKTLPYVFLALIDVPLILAVAVLVFHVPIRGPLWELALGSVFFIFTTVSIGMLISTFARNQQQAMMGAFMTLMPCVLLSGLYYPLDNMPEILRWITVVNPLRYFIVLLRGVMLKGGDPGVFWPNLGAIACIGTLVATISIKRFKQTLN